MTIPNNKELFENVIKTAFGEALNEDGKQLDEDDIKNLSDQEIIDKIKIKFRRRVMEEGPSILNKSDLDKSRFFELMMDTCNLRGLSNKI